MKCENCKSDHDGSYGSGRFCSKKCARGFSTKSKRKEINEMVSLKLKKTHLCEVCGLKSIRKHHKKCRDCYRKTIIISEETRKKLSNSRLKYLESGKSHVKWFAFSVNGKELKVQGTWEKRLAEKLNSLNILWERKILIYSKYRKYTPDFYIPKFDIYIEVKGFFYEKDKVKMFKVLDEHQNLKLKIIENINTIENILNENDLKLIDNFIDKYNKSDIDYSKFKDHWNS